MTKPKDPLTQLLNCKVTKADRDLFKKKAGRRGMSAKLRQLVLDYLKGSG
jgi:hypothetical protein